MFGNPLSLSRRLFPGCRYRLLCLLAGCRSLGSGLLRRPRLLVGFRCRRRLRLSGHLRLLPGFRLRPLPLSSPPSTPAAGLPPPPAAALPPPLPPSSVWLPFLPCNCLCILQARQRTNVRPLCPGSEKKTRTICRAKSKPFRFSNNGQQCSCKEVTVKVGGTLLPGITHEQA